MRSRILLPALAAAVQTWSTTSAAAPPSTNASPSPPTVAPPAPRERDDARAVERPTVGAPRPPGPSGWSLGAYGEVLGSSRFFHPDPKQTGRYRQTDFDVARLAMFIDNKIARWLYFSAELEIEHGGTGATKEIEWEEFGEYETDVEKGGEVQLEQAYLEAELGPAFGIRVGHLLVPVGMTTTYHTPIMFSATRRPESEMRLLPSIWHETGAEVFVRTRLLSLRAQVATGLDSTGFSSQSWIAGGTQRRFETALANDLGFALGLEFTGIPKTLIGISAYTTNTTGNRPKRDMDGVDARLVIGDVHMRGQYGPLRVRALAMAGTLANADEITTKNATLSNALGAPRTPVGSGAYAVWAEAALDVLAASGARTRHRLDVFARFDAYDTMWRAPNGVDNPLLERRVLTTGINYFPHPRVVVKAEYLSRWINQGGTWGLRQEEANAALGWVL